MDTKSFFVAVSVCTLSGQVIAGEFFFSQAEYEASVSIIDSNGFDDVIPGTQSAYSYTFGDYAYSISSLDTGGSGLSNGDGYVQLAGGNESMLISFTGAPVTAFSANLWATDDTGNPGAGAYIIITISNGDSIIQSSTSQENFFSYISDTAFDSIQVSYSAGSPQMPTYAAIDNLGIAQAIPAPGAATALGMMIVGITRRRR